MITRLAILGATGSVGTQALDVVRAHPDLLRVTALQAKRQGAGLAKLAAEFGARSLLGELDLDALVTADDVDLVLVATPGIAGLRPTLAALGAGKSVALANKEVLVTGGHLVRAACGGAGPRLRPIDSEHCALWQCLVGERSSEIERVTLTASGGAFEGASDGGLRVTFVGSVMSGLLAAGGATLRGLGPSGATACTARPPIGVMPPVRGPDDPPRLIVITVRGLSAAVSPIGIRSTAAKSPTWSTSDTTIFKQKKLI